ncbi:UNKNOWN [Stylonychia lemnae]|uniref:Uncharacterized protein n=1 Tax=Stylonychia lemnae TaxID=5949 RepID=A0A078B2F7_STYLE|nr:UNKNOWN [Stylonychia lemnae]|eukprot:CDW88730.1 UNKNOWN [Stylonychia lemnae]
MRTLPEPEFSYGQPVPKETDGVGRQQIDIRLKEPKRQGAMLLPEEEFTYGKANRPSTPIKAVVSGFYGDVAEQQILTRYEVLKEQSKPVSLAYARNHTRGSQLAQDHMRETSTKDQFGTSTQNLFKMKKFQNVQPRTNTHNQMRRTSSQAVLNRQR